MSAVLSFLLVQLAEASDRPTITFVMNTHDHTHVDESADTVIRAAGIFRKYGVKGDFYLTGPITQAYVNERSDAVSALRDMGISYHVRAPHPLSDGFTGPLMALRTKEQKVAVIKQYETYAQDMATGELKTGTLGGYTLVKNTFGRAPSCVGLSISNIPLREAAMEVFASMGAKCVITTHASSTPKADPFTWYGTLLERPGDINITRWGDRNDFWWNRIEEDPTNYDPLPKMREALKSWTLSRTPYITSLIHENNFERSGPEGWTLSYYTDRTKKTIRQPTYPLTGVDTSKSRNKREKEAIWAAYERWVQWSAANMRVATSEEIYGTALAAKN